MLNKTTNKYNLIFLQLFVLCFILLENPCNAGLSFQGPSGFINTPSHKTIPEKEIELSVKTRKYGSYRGDKTKDGYMTSFLSVFPR